jgi:hypothetical protein
MSAPQQVQQPPLPPDWQKNQYGYPGAAGWDPASAAVGYHQQSTLSPLGATKSFLTTEAPMRLDEFRRGAEPLISEMFRGQYLQGTETLANQRGESDRQAQDQFSAMGIAPSVYQGRIQPGQDQQYAQQSAALRGQTAMGEADARMNLQAQILNALNQTEAFYDTLKLQNYLASKARAAAREGAQAATTASLVGGALGAGATLGAGYFAGPK